MSVYKRPDSPHYYYEHEIRGRRFRGSTGCSSRREAEAWERRQREQNEAERVRELEAIQTEDPTLDELFARYWSVYGAKLKWGESVQAHLRGVLEVLGPHRRVSSLTDGDLAKVLEAYAQQPGRNGRPPTDSTVNRRLAVFRAVLNTARDVWSISVPNLKWKRHARPEPEARTRHITYEQAKVLLQALPPHLRLFVRFDLATGCRKNEILTLEASRINFHTRRAEVLTKGRGNKTRMVTLSAEALNILSSMDLKRKPLFDATNFRRHWARACATAGLEDFRVHDLRHTFATWVGRSAGLHVVQQLLGHSRIETTMKYLHVIEGDTDLAVARLPSLEDTPLVEDLRARRTKGGSGSTE